MPLTYRAILINFNAEVDCIRLPAGLQIRELAGQEVDELYGGFVSRRLRGIPHVVLRFAFVGVVNEPILFADGSLTGESNVVIQLRQDLDRGILALRSFKNGRVGIEAIHLTTDACCPMFGSVSLTYTNAYTPLGGYQLSAAEVPRFEEHAQRVFSPLHASLEVACSRLADAENRLNARDRLIDAVIGMEAIVLGFTGGRPTAAS